MKKVVLTGGGTAGHVTPNIAIAHALKELGYDLEYIGSKTGIEKDLITNMPYHPISSGKLRRYINLKNFSDAFRVVAGVFDAIKVLKKSNPQVVFSKGGFVTVPVVIAARFLKIPVVIHESDITAGLANKISLPFTSVICISFPETMQYMPKDKTILTGPPLREELFNGDKEIGMKLTGFHNKKPIILVIGGSLGSVKINNSIRNCLDKLTEQFQIIHICGKGNKDDSIVRDGYIQFEYVKENLQHLMALADLVVSRAGSNAIYELLALKKPNLLIPLSKNASRGDQILNARSFEKQGFSKVLEEENIDDNTLIENITDLYNSKDKYIFAMQSSKLKNGVKEIVKIIESL